MLHGTWTCSYTPSRLLWLHCISFHHMLALDQHILLSLFVYHWLSYYRYSIGSIYSSHHQLKKGDGKRQSFYNTHAPIITVLTKFLILSLWVVSYLPTTFSFPLKYPFNEWMNDWMSEGMSEWMSEWISQAVISTELIIH